MYIYCVTLYATPKVYTGANGPPWWLGGEEITLLLVPFDFAIYFSDNPDDQNQQDTLLQSYDSANGLMLK